VLARALALTPPITDQESLDSRRGSTPAAADTEWGRPAIPVERSVMVQHGKKYVEAAKLVDRASVYAPDEAAKLAKDTTTVKFDATIEAHIRLGVDPRHADQMVRGTVVLPNGTGKVTRVAVFAQGEKAQEALRAGADEVGAEDLVKKIEAGWLDFDVALATPDLMGQVGRLGKILGRRGLMPNPKAGTITFDLDRAIREVKGGRVEFKVDKTAIIHVPVGKASFEADALVANLAALVDAVNRAKPSGAKGTYLRTLTIASTMGPGIRVDIPGILAAAAAA
jgi:large subunit ribosomal protein L1